MSATFLPPEAADRIKPDFHQVNLDVEGFIKTNLGIKLDKGTSRSFTARERRVERDGVDARVRVRLLQHQRDWPLE
jgi:hypothetical protein